MQPLFLPVPYRYTQIHKNVLASILQHQQSQKLAKLEHQLSAVQSKNQHKHSSMLGVNYDCLAGAIIKMSFIVSYS